MGDLFQPFHLIFLFVLSLIIIPVYVIPYWVIFRKAGFAPALSFLVGIPLVNLIVLYYIAFSDWKARAEDAALHPLP